MPRQDQAKLNTWNPKMEEFDDENAEDEDDPDCGHDAVYASDSGECHGGNGVGAGYGCDEPEIGCHLYAGPQCHQQGRLCYCQEIPEYQLCLLRPADEPGHVRGSASEGRMH